MIAHSLLRPILKKEHFFFDDRPLLGQTDERALLR
jgi:hypothetical protein